MNQNSKRMKECYKDIDKEKMYQDLEAIKILKSKSSVKFVESMDVSINLGVDAKKSDQQVRGVLSLPKMPEKKIRIDFNVNKYIFIVE